MSPDQEHEWRFLKKQAQECPECGGTRYEPVIVTPTFLKSYDNPFIKDIWRAIEAELRRAERITFIGYSLPDADIMLRTMFSRAWYQAKCPVTVVNSDSQSKSNYERLFGHVRFIGKGFRQYVQDGG